MPTSFEKVTTNADPFIRMVRFGNMSQSQLDAVHQLQAIISAASSSLGFHRLPNTPIANLWRSRDFNLELVCSAVVNDLFQRWYRKLAKQRSFVMDMLLNRHTLVETAAKHGMHFRTARKRFLRSIDLWDEMCQK